MRIDLTEREIELIIHMLTESVTKVNDGKEKFNFSVDEIILLEKLEETLRIKDIENIGDNKSVTKSKYLN